jgi:multidrug efflux pump subunit AcrA (membrane-fusion protein)
MLENNIKKSYLLFILSIPVFFILSITALYFIEMDEWVEGTGQIVPSDEVVLYLPENAQLKEFHSKPGEPVKKGDVLAVFTSLDREEEIAQLQKETSQIQDEIKLKEISHALLLLSPLEEKFENAANQLNYLHEKVLLLSNRLSKLDQLKEKGILSAEEIEDIRIKLADAKNDEKAIELRAGKDIKSIQDIIGLRYILVSLEIL